MTVLQFQICARVLAARCARVFTRTVRPTNQRAQGMPGAQCTRSLACDRNKAHERSHHGHTGITRHSPRNGFTAYCVLSPATNSSCHRHPRIKVLSKARSGRLASANLTPATGVRTTRLHRPQHLISAKGFDGLSIVRLRAIRQLTGLVDPPCHPLTSPDALASTASRPALVTTRDRPSDRNETVESVN